MSASAPGLRHRLEYLFLRAVAGLVRVLPEPLALAIGSGLGWLAGSGLRIRRRVVDRNLERAFPDRPRAARRRIAAASYRHLGREGVAFLRMTALAPGEVRERTRVEGMEALRAALAEGRGVLLLTGHVGNWEVGGAALAARGVPLDVVARRQKNPLFERNLTSARERLGMRVVYRHEGARPILGALRGGRAVALVADQNVREGGVFVDFFGTPAATIRGPALMARRTGARVLLGMALREPGGRARYRVLLRPLDVPSTGDAQRDDHALLTAYVAGLEEAVRQVPEQYFWPHRRWKTRPLEAGRT